jgi:hypothetical protein
MPESGQKPIGPNRLVTYIKFAANQMQRRRNQVRTLDVRTAEVAQQRLLATLEGARGGAVREVRRVELRQVRRGVWVASGLRVNAGETVTLFSWGAVWISKLLDIGCDPGTALWVRVRGSPIRKMVSDAMTFTLRSSGELELSVRAPGEWLDEDGAPDHGQSVSAGLSGTITAVAVVWNGEAEPALTALQGAGQTEFIQRALDNIREGRNVPSGWNYLWRLGDGQMFREERQGGLPTVKCHTKGDVGILQYPVDVKLEPGTELRWSWCVESLPSALPEHIRPTHDYLSLAVEFDNGLDLTYIWSASLPQGYIFRCPLPWWCDRETHWVVRSGREELGQWVSERRDVFADYQQAIGGPMPARIARVWLIAVSVFQRQTGVCSYQDVTIGAGEERQRVL